MQEAAAETGRRPAQYQQFAGVDLRRPKGYAAPAAAQVAAAAAPAEGDPCPRCESRDTKFCYYNNYNTSQPRHFCKGCRRYWTKGGTLRNVPVGGGTRKKPSSSSPPSSYAANSDKPKKPHKKKRRVVAPQEPAVVASAAAATPVVVVAPASDSAKSTTTKETTTTTTTTKAAATPTTTDPASEITTELVVPAAAEEEDSLAHLLQPDAAAVALGLGISDFPAGKGLDLEPADSFEWPAAFDLGSCWGGAGFADPDPAGLFLNLP